jgi:hypothetical protein
MKRAAAYSEHLETKVYVHSNHCSVIKRRHMSALQ